MNPFCIECVSDQHTVTDEVRDEIRECEDRNCPFYPYRRITLTWQDGGDE